MKIKIFQINQQRDKNNIKFMNLNYIREKVGYLTADIYDVAFSGEVDCQSLEDVYTVFNRDIRPEGFIGHSLSVSDVVQIIDGRDCEPGFYFCDSIGWSRLWVKEMIAMNKQIPRIEDYTGNLKAKYPQPDGNYSEYIPPVLEQLDLVPNKKAIGKNGELFVINDDRRKAVVDSEGHIKEIR